MQNKNKAKTLEKSNERLGKFLEKRFLTIFICIFLAMLVIFGTVFGIIVAVQSSRTAAEYGSVSMSEGALKFLAPYYKQRYIRLLASTGVSVTDNESFWQSEAEDGKSYGELFEESYEQYIRALLVSASLYDIALSYGSAERREVRAAVDAVVDKVSDGNKREFNLLCEKYGFDYDGMLDASMFIYKSSRAFSALYGGDGSGIKNSPEEN